LPAVVSTKKKKKKPKKMESSKVEQGEDSGSRFLPVEVWERVLLYLSPQDICLSFAPVCREFHAVHDLPFVWASILRRYTVPNPLQAASAFSHSWNFRQEAGGTLRKEKRCSPMCACGRMCGSSTPQQPWAVPSVSPLASTGSASTSAVWHVCSCCSCCMALALLLVDLICGCLLL